MWQELKTKETSCIVTKHVLYVLDKAVTQSKVYKRSHYFYVTSQQHFSVLSTIQLSH